MSSRSSIPNSASAMNRMHRYTTMSLCIAVTALIMVVVLQAPDLWAMALVFVSGALVAVQVVFWEKRPSWWLSGPSIALAYGVWLVAIATQTMPAAVVLVSLAVGIHTSQKHRWRTAFVIGSFIVIVAPLLIALPSFNTDEWFRWAWLLMFGFFGAYGFFSLNDYAWGLYLEIDAARRIGEDLAVAQERYRLAADLHDIQGHTLHVIRLKTQLAHRLIDSNPAAAKEQLDEAELLIAETLSNTRSLAYGERRVALASEIANAEQLLEAAGIRFTLTGDPAGMPHEELFALVMRESTTNILRHAQPSRVSVTVTPGSVVIANDGSPDATRAPSGLARLGERFEQVGGTLRTTVVDGVFTTEATA